MYKIRILFTLFVLFLSLSSCGRWNNITETEANLIWNEYLALKVEDMDTGRHTPDILLRDRAAGTHSYKNWNTFRDKYERSFGKEKWENISIKKNRALANRILSIAKARQ